MKAFARRIDPQKNSQKSNSKESATSEGSEVGISYAPPPFQLEASEIPADPSDPSEGKKQGRVQGNKSVNKSTAHTPVQRIPRSPQATPFEGKVIPGSTPIRENPDLNSRRLIDVPRNHPVEVLGGDAWLHCRTRIGVQDYDGYISHEQIKREVDFTNTTDTGNAYTSKLTMFNHTFAITKEVNFVDSGGFAEGAYVRLRTRTISAIRSYLDRKYKVKIESPEGERQHGDGEYPIVLSVAHNSSADYSVELNGGEAGTSYMSSSGGEIYELGQPGEGMIPDITLAHEGSHMVLGASDEYANARVPARVLTDDHSLMANYYVQGVDEAEIKVRHFGFLVYQISAMFPDRTISIVE